MPVSCTLHTVHTRPQIANDCDTNLFPVKRCSHHVQLTALPVLHGCVPIRRADGCRRRAVAPWRPCAHPCQRCGAATQMTRAVRLSTPPRGMHALVTVPVDAVLRAARPCRLAECPGALHRRRQSDTIAISVLIILGRPIQQGITVQQHCSYRHWYTGNQ